jgi:hypothetical protein
MRYWRIFLSKTKNQPDIWFFYGFLLTFALTVRKVLFYFPIKGAFNEYTGIYVYISDIFLFLTLLFWVISILCNKFSLLSMFKLWITRNIRNLFSRIKFELQFILPNCSTRNKNIENENNEISKSDYSFNVSRLPAVLEGGTFKNYSLYLIPLILVIWSFISILWSENQTIALFRSIKLIEYYLLFLYIAFRINPLWGSDKKAEDCSMLARYAGKGNILFLLIIIISLFQAIIGIFQFILQHSLGLFWLKESLISQDLPGVAKIIINGHKYIRSYGLFPHPNILGGFLLFSIILSLLYKKLFRHLKAENVPARKEIECSIWNIQFQRDKYVTYINVSIAIQIFALLLTFSKSALFGFLIAMLYVIYFPRLAGKSKMFHACPVVSNCFTWNNWKLYGEEHFGVFKIRLKKRKVLLALIMLFLVIIAKPDIRSFFINSYEERLVYLDASPVRISTQSVAGGRGTIEDYEVLLFGIGQGQFVLNMQKYPERISESWQFQPVHNVFLLIWSELGIIGLGLFLLFIIKILRHYYDFLSSCIVNHHFKAILVGFIFIMLFDHYFWDIQQGSFLLWITLGAIAGNSRRCYNKNIAKL